MASVVFKNGVIVDGTGAPGFVSDVTVEGDRITSIGSSLHGKNTRVVDITGLTLTPGFVDIHSHSDYYLVVEPLAYSKIYQGVTTEIGGNCGYSAAPVYGKTLEERREQYFSQFGISHDWDSLDTYFKLLASKGISVNYGHLLGSNTIRSSVCGFGSEVPDEGETDKMCAIIEEGMEAGALGLSYGLAYVPTCYSKKRELEKMAETVRRFGGVIAAHIRSESRGLLDALREIVSVAGSVGVPLQISHLKAMGRGNWHKIGDAFAIIEEAIANGIQVTCDRYPYLAANTGLQSILPDRVLAGGRDRALERISNTVERNRIAEEIESLHPEESFWDDVMVCQVGGAESRFAEGKTIQQNAAEKRVRPIDFFFDILIKERMEVDAIFFAMNRENLERVLKKEYVMIGSDAGARSIEGPLGTGYPHPRSFGTFPRVLESVRKNSLMGLSEAIHKMTFAPCKKMGLKGRGLIREGYFADITVFDFDTVADRSTYAAPRQYPAGIEYVMVNGTFVIERGKHNGSGPGRVLTRKERFSPGIGVRE